MIRGCIALVTLLVSVGTALAQRAVLPDLDFDRRTDARYTDSLLRMGHHSLRRAEAMPRSSQSDTLRLEALRFMTAVFKQMRGPQRDSSYYYARLLTAQARRRGNRLYQMHGLLQQENYQRLVRNNYRQALELNTQAARLAVGQSAARYPLWQVHMNLADIYLLQKDYTDATANYRAALTLLPQYTLLTRRNTRLLTSQAVSQLGEIAVARGQVDEARQRFEESLKIAQEVNSQINIAYANERLGDFWLTRQQPARATSYYEDALRIWTQLGDEVGQASDWARLAECYLLTGKLDQAIKEGERALQIARQHGHYRIQQMASWALYRAYRADGQTAPALAMHEVVVALRDTLSYRQRVEDLVTLQRRFDRERVQADAERQRIGQLADLRRKTDLERLQLNAQAHEANIRRALESQRLRAETEAARLRQQARIDGLDNDLTQQRIIRTGLVTGMLALLFFAVLMILQNRQIARQKQEIVALNQGLEDKVQARTAELEQANKQLRTKNREIEDALLRGQTQERKRVAADLHDNLGGLLSAIKMSLSALNPQNLSAREQPIYENLLAMTRDAYAEVRYLSHNLQPDELEQQGLANALQRLVEKLTFTQRIAFSLDAAALPKLTPKAEFHLYSICVELCNNILKHSLATEAGIQFRRQNDTLHMMVRDNGRGLQTDRPTGMGLRNIRARTEALHGRLDVQSDLHTGTTFFFVLPLPVTFVVADT